jgi:hypothetical protein
MFTYQLIDSSSYTNDYESHYKLYLLGTTSKEISLFDWSGWSKDSIQFDKYLREVLCFHHRSPWFLVVSRSNGCMGGYS